VTAVGTALPEFVDAPLTVTDFVRYQGASGDMTPLHHDPDMARAAGFPSVFAPGMLAAGILGGYLVGLFGAAAIRRFGVRFEEQAWPGDVLSYGGRVSAVAGDAVELELVVRRQTGAVHVTGWATVVGGGGTP
jgi:acyl dehydratase